MNSLTKLLCGAAIAATVAGLHAGDDHKEKRRHHKGFPPIALVQALDANKDHVISADEIANASAALKALDANGDGKLDPSEFIGRPGKPGPDEEDELMAAPPPAPGK